MTETCTDETTGASRLGDTHVHINFESFDVDIDDVAAAWRKAGVLT